MRQKFNFCYRNYKSVKQISQHNFTRVKPFVVTCQCKSLELIPLVPTAATIHYTMQSQPTLCTHITPFPADRLCLLKRTCYNALSMGGKPQNCPFPLEICHLPDEDRATAIGNLYKNLENISRVSRTYPCGQTRKDRHIDTQTERRANDNTSPPLSPAK